MSPTTFAQAEINLAQSLSGYESRAQQQDLARAIEHSIQTKTHLLAEAPTGVGKSLAYLIPAILSNKRVIVSTATKALQNQLWDKDLPFLQEHLGVNFSAALLKGRSNFICVEKFLTVDAGDLPHRDEIRDLILVDGLDMNLEFSGEREDLAEAMGFEIETREWMKIAADSDDCRSLGCKASGLCYAEYAKAKAEQAQVVVVNHALYMTDIMVQASSGGNASFLGPHQIAIFDEAHEIEPYASGALGTTFKEGGIRGMLSEIRNLFHRHIPDYEDQVNDLISDVETTMADLWDILEPGRIRDVTLIEHADQFVGFANALVELAEFLPDHRLLEMVGGSYADTKKKLGRMHTRAANAAERFSRVITASFDDMVRWVEIEKERPVLKSAPIDVAPFLRDWLFGYEGGVSTVLVSATIAVNGSFDYISDTLGIDEYETLIVDSAFDFGIQAATYVPTHLPDPAKERAAWSSMAIEEMMDLIRISEGSALLLFTSFSEMRTAYERISSRVPYRCLMQGQAANKALAQQFKEEESSVLFATRSFMTGFDARGDTLRLVVINKLPFPVPTEPLVEAKCEKIKRQGGNDFIEYTIPVMSLILKQAYGRLIRSRSDTGVVALLDPRLETKPYGKGILRSLPDAPVINVMTDIEKVYDGFKKVEVAS